MEFRVEMDKISNRIKELDSLNQKLKEKSWKSDIKIAELL